MHVRHIIFLTKIIISLTNIEELCTEKESQKIKNQFLQLYVIPRLCMEAADLSPLSLTRKIFMTVVFEYSSQSRSMYEQLALTSY